MYVALNGVGQKVLINDANDRDKYFCPSCGAEMIMRRGTIRQAHFAHKRTECTDTWNRGTSGYELSPWHHEWQSQFPLENQEVTLTFGEVKHRGDVVIGRTVVEFQHSPINSKKFGDRTNFYDSCGCKMVWLFDLQEDSASGSFFQIKDNAFKWTNKSRAFNYLDSLYGVVDLFMQLKDREENESIVKITKIVGDLFYFDKWYSKEDFLRFLGNENGKYPLPELDEIDLNPAYLEFREKYNVQLNKQQERAIQLLDGASLILAVPGSGKTTTLVTRLGFMTKVHGIDPNSILALTYTRAATEEMKKRYSDKFGQDGLVIRTIHSLCRDILKTAGYSCNLIGDREKKNILRDLYKETTKEKWVSNAELIDVETEIDYAKNMMFDSENDFNGLRTANLYQIFTRYNKALVERNQIDYDDMLLKAYEILCNAYDIRTHYQDKFKYLCVDEAQDTSLIQHKIIQILAEKHNNIFMVGDEDQSIYGFRGAYPQALFEFNHTYRNPYIHKIETNYRSHEEITSLARKFIDRNPNRRNKNMQSMIGQGGEVRVVDVEDRTKQFDFIVDECKLRNGEIAIIYRNNDTAIPLIDLFERNGISYYLNEMNDTFSSSKSIDLVKKVLEFSLDTNKWWLLKEFWSKFKDNLPEKQIDFACKNSYSRKTDLLKELVEQKRYLKWQDCHNIDTFVFFIKQLKEKTALEAINEICIYFYVKSRNGETDQDKVDILKIIASKTTSIQDLLNRLKFLEMIIKKRNNCPKNGVCLTTIHSCKGLEYETVYLADVTDGILPSRKSETLKQEEKFGNAEEERRLFYVAMTRAKKNLVLIRQQDANHEYIDELFNEPKRENCEFVKKPKLSGRLPVYTEPSVSKEEILSSFGVKVSNAEHDKIVSAKTNNYHGLQFDLTDPLQKLFAEAMDMGIIIYKPQYKFSELWFQNVNFPLDIEDILFRLDREPELVERIKQAIEHA